MMDRQETALLDEDERSEEIYRAGSSAGRVNGRLADQQVPVPRRVLRRQAEDDFDETGDGGFLRSQTRIRVRRGLIPESPWGRILAGCAALVLIVGMIATMMAVRHYLLHDPRFLIDTSSEIQIDGNSHVSRPELLSIFGEDLERNLFHVPLAERRSELEQLPWVEHATVMRLLPNRLRVTVVERTPVAFVRQGGTIGLVDAHGVLLDMPAGDDAGTTKYSFPVLTGINGADPLSTRAARMNIYGQFMHDLDSGGTKISDTLSEVDVSSPEDVKALIPSQTAEVLVHFGDEDFLARYQRFQQLLPSWRAQYPDLASVDMRYPSQVVLGMATGLNATADAASTASAAPAAVSVPVQQETTQVATTDVNSGKRSAATPMTAAPVIAPASQTASKSAAKTVPVVKAPAKPAPIATKQVSKAAAAAAAKATPAQTTNAVNVVPATKKTLPTALTGKISNAKSVAKTPVALKIPAAPGTPKAAQTGAYSTDHPLTQAFDVPAKKAAPSTKKPAATAKKPSAAKKSASKAKAPVVKSKVKPAPAAAKPAQTE